MILRSENKLFRTSAKRQNGVILLLMVSVLLLAGVSMLMRVLSNNEVSLEEGTNTTNALSKAKEALISYAVHYVDYYGAASAGPGHLLCPDTDGDGAENDPCLIAVVGRLPTSITVPSGDVYPLSSYYNDIGQQFWYTLSDSFLSLSVAALNTTSVGNLTLDGQGGIAAILIAPEQANASQTRNNNNSLNYLEAGNVAGPNFVTSDPLDPNNFDDRVIAITLSEIFSPVTARVAEVIRIQLDDFHAFRGRYPTDQNEFEAVLNGNPGGGGGGGGGGKGGKGGKGGGGGPLNPMPPWFIGNDWFSVSNYTQISNDSGAVQFTACNISYTLNFGSNRILKTGTQC